MEPKINKKEELLREAVHQHYQCDGKYPCEERAYCRFCEGMNDANDCSDECFAEEFAEGFEAGWDAGAKWRVNSVWHDSSEKPDTDKGDLIVCINVMGGVIYVAQSASYVLKYGCVRWAYIDDLIPSKED